MPKGPEGSSRICCKIGFGSTGLAGIIVYLPTMRKWLVASMIAGLIGTGVHGQPPSGHPPAGQSPPEKYSVDAASEEHAGVPKGELLHFTLNKSNIFPGTRREYWVYVPAQYRPDKPACVYVNQDGVQWKAPTVFDNLINSGEMPVTVGIFVQPGRVIAQDTAAELDRFNRSFEYDGIGDGYSRMLLDELLPEVEKQHTSD